MKPFQRWKEKECHEKSVAEISYVNTVIGFLQIG